MRVLVTGGAGFIGSHIVDCLLERGEQVLVADDLSAGSRENVSPGAEFHDRSVLEPGLTELLTGCDAVVHAAAQTSVAAASADPEADARINITGTIRTLLAAGRSGVRRVVYLSSAAIYGNASQPPIDEAQPAAPTSPYGLSKWAGEQYVRLIADMCGLEWVVLRLANVYGPRQSPRGEAGVVARWCSAVGAGEPLQLHGDGSQTRDFVYVGDVAHAVVTALDHPEAGGGTFNVGTGSEIAIREILTRLEGVLGRPAVVRQLPGRPGDVVRSALNSERIRVRLGWEPRIPLDEGLARTTAWRDPL